MKIIFFGSDAFSIKALEACLHSGMEVAMIVTTPAQKKGRGLKLEPSEVAAYCLAKALPTVEYPSLKDPQVARDLLALRPDIFVVASYGKLIPNSLLKIPKYRLNVHPSLIPKYRGSAPVHWPILNGDQETGVSIIDIAEKLDAGDIYCQEKIPIPADVNAAELTSELARFSYGLLKKVLEQVRNGKLRGTPQNESEATLAPQLSKTDGALSFHAMTAETLDRKIRGLQPWPGAFAFMNGERVAILRNDLPAIETNEKPGTVLAIEKDGGLVLATARGAIRLLRVKPEGKKEMAAAEFARGRRLVPGAEIHEKNPPV
ncbi:MAG: methionyl-tRNA formyltransferase [Geobacteraceae bacterium]|nr:methionyl-tRNA formyltransferase [Geobacteraceae bacterium]